MYWNQPRGSHIEQWLIHMMEYYAEWELMWNDFPDRLLSEKGKIQRDSYSMLPFVKEKKRK